MRSPSAATNPRLFSASRSIAICAFAVVGAILLTYVLHFHKVNFSSDDAVVNTLADAIREQGRLLPRGWINNNGDLMMPSGALVVAAVAPWLGNGFAAHSIAGLLAVILLLASLRWLLLRLGIVGPAAIAILTLAASGLSLQSAYLVYAQTTYFWWPAGFMCIAAILCGYRRGRDYALSSTWRVTAAAFLVVFLISFANPARVLLMMAFPLYLFDRVLANGQEIGASGMGRVEKWLRVAGAYDPVTMFGLVGAFICAALAYAMLQVMGVTEAAYGAANLRWAGWPSVVRHAAVFAHGWLSYLGADADWSAFPRLVAYPLWWFRIGIVAWLTMIGPIELWRFRNCRDPARRAMTLALVAAFVPIFLMYLAFEPLALGSGTIRYFQLSIYILLVLAAFQLRDMSARLPSATPTLLAVAGVMLMAVSAQRFLPLTSVGSGAFWNVDRSSSVRLANALRGLGLQWGYASWWTAGAASVMAEFEAHVNPVSLRSTGVTPDPAMVLRDWYRPDGWVGPTFLALNGSESSPDKLDALEARLGLPVRSIDAASYKILVYDHNIARDFACIAESPMNRPIENGVSSAKLLSAQLKQAANGHLLLAEVKMRNDGTTVVSGNGRYPLAVGVQLLGANGNVTQANWLHAPLPCPIPVQQEATFTIILPKLVEPAWGIRIDLVQEGVAWFHQRGMKTIDLPFSATTGASSSSDLH